MSVIGEKVTEFSGKISTVTMTETETTVNAEVDAGPFGMVLYTVIFRQAADAAGKTGPQTIRGQAFLPDGSTLTFAGGGAWRNSGHCRELKHTTLISDGQRSFAVENLDFTARTTAGTIYAMD